MGDIAHEDGIFQVRSQDETHMGERPWGRDQLEPKRKFFTGDYRSHGGICLPFTYNGRNAYHARMASCRLGHRMKLIWVKGLGVRTIYSEKEKNLQGISGSPGGLGGLQ